MLKFVIIGVSSIIIGLIIILLLIKYVGKENAINHYLKIVKNNKFLEVENRITSAVTTFEKVTLLFCIQFFLIMLIVNLIARVVPDLSNCNNTINNILIFIITEDTASSALLIAFINYTKKYYVCFDYNEIVKKHHIKSSNIVMLSETFIVSLCYAVSLMINYSELQCLLYCISISASIIASLFWIYSSAKSLNIMFSNNRDELVILNSLYFDKRMPKPLISSEIDGIEISTEYLLKRYFYFADNFEKELNKRKLQINNLKYKDNFTNSKQNVINMIRSYPPLIIFYCFLSFCFLCIGTDTLYWLIVIGVDIFLGTISHIIMLFTNRTYRIISLQIINRGWSYNIDNRLFFQSDSGKKYATNFIHSLESLITMAQRITISNRGTCCIDYFFETIIKYKQNNNNIYYNIAYNLCTYFSYKHFNDKEYIYKIATKETNAFNDNIFNIGQSIVFEIEREDPNLYKHMQDELFQYRFKKFIKC